MVRIFKLNYYKLLQIITSAVSWNFPQYISELQILLNYSKLKRWFRYLEQNEG